MSMDLELLRLPTIRVQSSGATSFDGGDASRLGNCEDELDSESSCRTPTSEEHKIPAILSCPPAPRKARAAVPAQARAYKRKLAATELQFFEIVARDEVEAFFRSFDLPVGSGRTMKRRCTCK